jgi:hypothetical protein
LEYADLHEIVEKVSSKLITRRSLVSFDKLKTFGSSINSEPPANPTPAIFKINDLAGAGLRFGSYNFSFVADFSIPTL